MPASVLLIDDHPTFRAGFASVLPPLPVSLHEAPSMQRALAFLDHHPAPDLVVYDWHLPDGGGLLGLSTLLQLLPQVPLAVISSSEDGTVALAATQMGARAFIPKSAEPAEIRETVARLLGLAQAAAPPVRPPAPAVHLTARQLEVLRLVAEGHPNKEIAKRLGIAEPTVRDHVSEVLTALHARNRTEATTLAARQGLLDGNGS